MYRYFEICLLLVTSLFFMGIMGCSTELSTMDQSLGYDAMERKISVDGNLNDWIGIQQNIVQGSGHLWIDAKSGLARENWKGNDDL
ncbi:MAG: hypothetical protein JRE47_12335, partial [Deltaproteobacteria bacterium]|nr:hypothetical protein [Deltaproteobacteria bacterium]